MSKVQGQTRRGASQSDCCLCQEKLWLHFLQYCTRLDGTMARNQEKANSMLARFREAQAIELGLKRKTPLRRPFDPESKKKGESGHR